MVVEKRARRAQTMLAWGLATGRVSKLQRLPLLLILAIGKLPSSQAALTQYTTGQCVPQTAAETKLSLSSANLLHNNMGGAGCGFEGGGSDSWNARGTTCAETSPLALRELQNEANGGLCADSRTRATCITEQIRYDPVCTDNSGVTKTCTDCYGLRCNYGDAKGYYLLDYFWQEENTYLSEHGIDNGIAGLLDPTVVASVAAAGIFVDGVERVDNFLADPETRIRNMFVDQSLADTMIARILKPELEDVGLKNFYTTAKLSWQPRSHDPNLPKWLHLIDVPTLILWGDQDKLFPPAHAEAYGKLIPGSEVVVLDQCGHLPNVEKTDEFVSTLTRFAAQAHITEGARS